MEKWETVLLLKFRLIPWRMKVRFCFEWKAWLIAYEKLGFGPEGLDKLPTDQQIDAIAYGAAAWARLKAGKKVYFTPEQLKEALMGASRAANLILAETLSYAQFPDWLKAGMPEVDKKKAEV